MESEKTIMDDTAMAFKLTGHSKLIAIMVAYKLMTHFAWTQHAYINQLRTSTTLGTNIAREYVNSDTSYVVMEITKKKSIMLKICKLLNQKNTYIFIHRYLDTFYFLQGVAIARHKLVFHLSKTCIFLSPERVLQLFILLSCYIFSTFMDARIIRTFTLFSTKILSLAFLPFHHQDILKVKHIWIELLKSDRKRDIFFLACILFFLGSQSYKIEFSRFLLEILPS